jgi:O-antigen ligase
VAFAAAALMAHCVMFSFSRGGMLALCITGAAATYFVAIQPRHWWALAVAIVLAVRLAGPEVIERFATTFVEGEERDESAQSRVDMWGNCWDIMLKNPVFGAGPRNFPLLAPEYGWPRGKEAHTLWLQLGAETGFPGLGLLLAFYGSCMLGLWRLWRERSPDDAEPWFSAAASMVTTALVGFMIAAQFVSLVGLELPYYIVLFGAATLKVASQPAIERGVPTEAEDQHQDQDQEEPEPVCV